MTRLDDQLDRLAADAGFSEEAADRLMSRLSGQPSPRSLQRRERLMAVAFLSVVALSGVATGGVLAPRPAAAAVMPASQAGTVVALLGAR